jgi:single-strand DNA-binding protein
LWRDQAEVAKKYLVKGSAVLVEGKITNRTWDDKDGKRHYITEVVGDRINLIDSANKVERELVQPEQRESNISEALEPTTGDDLPF